MALDTVTALINGLNGDDATRRLIQEYSIAKSAVASIKAPARLTSPVVRGVNPGRQTAYAVAEGGTKTIASGVLSTVSYQVFPVALIIPVSNVLYRTAQETQQAVIATLSDAIGAGIDNEIINNPNSVFTTGLVAAAATAGNNNTSGAYLYNDLSSTFGDVESTYYSVDGVIARRSEMGALRLAVPSGQSMFTPLFSPANGDAPASIFGAQVAFVDSRVLPTTGAGSEIRYVVGDFSQLDWGIYGDLQIEAFDSGTAGVWNAITQNVTLVRAEVLMGFAVVNNAAFATLAE